MATRDKLIRRDTTYFGRACQLNLDDDDSAESRADLSRAAVRNGSGHHLAAAIAIAAAWRQYSSNRKRELTRLVNILEAVRCLAATTIQKTCRGFITRKFLESLHTSVFYYRPGITPNSVVEVIGEFTQPPWQQRLSMKFCPIRKLHSLALAGKLKEDRTLCRFLENGQYIDNPVYDTVDDQRNQLIVLL